MSNQNTQHPSSTKKQSRLPIFKSALPKNPALHTHAVLNPKVAIQNETTQAKTPSSCPKHRPSTIPIETIQSRPAPRKSSLPVRSSNNSPGITKLEAKPQISYVQQRARTQMMPKPELRRPTPGSDAVSRPLQFIVSTPPPKLSRQRTFAGDMPPSALASKQLYNESTALKPIQLPHVTPTYSSSKGCRTPSSIWAAASQSKSKNETNGSKGSSLGRNPHRNKSTLNSNEHHGPHEGQTNTTSKVQEKLPKSAGYDTQEREDDRNFTTNSSHNIYSKTNNNSRYSYTIKTQKMHGMEGNAGEDRKNCSLEKVTAIITSGIIETKSPSFMESSDSSDLEAIGFINNNQVSQVSNALNEVWAKLQSPPSSQVKEGGILNIPTPLLQSSEEIVTNLTMKLHSMNPSCISPENVPKETLESSPSCGNAKMMDLNDENESEELQQDWEIVYMEDVATENTYIRSNQELQDDTHGELTNVILPVLLVAPAIRDSKEWETEPQETVDTEQLNKPGESYMFPSNPSDDTYENENDALDSREVKVEAIPIIAYSTNEENPGNCNQSISGMDEVDTLRPESTEILCPDNNKTCSTSTSCEIVSPVETEMSDWNDRCHKKVENSSTNGDTRVSQSAQVEDILPPRQLKSSKHVQSSGVLRRSSDAASSEISSTISLRTSEGMPFAVSSVSLQVARLLSQCGPLQRSIGKETPNVESSPLALDQEETDLVLSTRKLPLDLSSVKVQKAKMTQEGVEEYTGRINKFLARPHTVVDNSSCDASTSKKRSKSRGTEGHIERRAPRTRTKERFPMPTPSSATMLMHDLHSPCLSCRMKTHKEYNMADGKKCKTVYFNPDLLPRSSKQIDANGAPLCLRRQSSQDILPLHFNHLVIDSAVSMYSVGSHLEGFLRIQNNSTKHICYRVVSLLPGRYQIIPSTGILERNQTVALTIASMVPKTFIKFEPDQFQVETIIAPPDVVTPTEQRLLWKETHPTQIQKALVGRLRIRNPSDSGFEMKERDKSIDASTSYGDGIVAKRVQQVRHHPQKQGVADICICTIILGILAAAIHRFSSITDY